MNEKKPTIEDVHNFTRNHLAMTDNAPVTAEIRKFWNEMFDAWAKGGPGPSRQILATFVAERERKARLDEAKWWHDGHVCNLILELPGGCSACKRMAELESAGTERSEK